jgi:hypothetical protein
VRPAPASKAIAALEGYLLEPLSRETAENGDASVPEASEARSVSVPAPRPPVVLCTSVGTAGGAAALGAALGVALATGDARTAAGAALLVDLANVGRAPGPTVLASEPAARLEDAIRTAHPSLAPAARGHLCCLALPGDADGLDSLAELLQGDLDAAAVVVHVPQALWARALADPRLGVAGGLLRGELPADRPLVGLAVGELRERGLRARVAKSPLGLIASRRALAGIDIGGAASRRVGRLARGLACERGQALPLVLGAVAALLVVALVLAAIGGAVTGKGRVQRAADLAALSGARSMRDDFERLFEPAVLPNGVPNPHHLSKAAYLARASASARVAAHMNGVDPGRLRVAFPDAISFAPVRIRADVTGEVDRRALPGGEPSARRAKPIPVAAHAVAEVAPPTSFNGMPTTATGGGYSGPLAYRQGKPMRPDVARAFDRLAGAARRAGISLTITSAYRSDAEQARLFAQHPDPRWVAPPGHSLHRCATELDLGPSSAYGWLARNARRFGFLKRYAWEPWHFGYTRGPAPCSAAGNAIGRGSDGESGSSAGLPGFVPVRFRAPILRAASRWNVSAGMLAAQLLAESNFNPNAVSPAGAQGIAQFMPGTAGAYGLRNPFDAAAAINAQAHLMSDLLRQFHSIPLALAAYNAGSGAVAACHCIPFAETRAYVARILGLLDGAGELLAPPLEVRLVS